MTLANHLIINNNFIASLKIIGLNRLSVNEIGLPKAAGFKPPQGEPWPLQNTGEGRMRALMGFGKFVGAFGELFIIAKVSGLTPT
jgi:hypothetical protein